MRLEIKNGYILCLDVSQQILKIIISNIYIIRKSHTPYSNNT